MRKISKFNENPIDLVANYTAVVVAHRRA